ncbi:MAG: lipopolysaccharide heptosyltransferase I [Desulfobulbaceae bacterium]|nr:lipopolysaccharide heptosyltransferase I [Desulfobulbaceae bacterium]
MKILLVKTSAIGDVLHTLPALAVLRNYYPKAKISWLVEEEAAGIVLGHPDIDNILISKRKKWLRDFRSGDRSKALKEFFSFIKLVRNEDYDLLIDFQGLLKSSLFIACCRAKRKVGFGRGMAHAEGSYLFLNEHIPPVPMDIHAVTRDLLLLEAIGIKSEKIRYTFPVDHEHLDKAKKLLSTVGVDSSKPLIAINPMTTWPTKHWSSKGFASVADHLIMTGIEVIFTGGASDKGAIQKTIALMNRGQAYNVAGETDLKTLAALFSFSQIVISTDTGPMHLAAAVNTPVVALFGPTAPWRTGPYGKHHQVVRKDLPCSPCLKKTCQFGSTLCMQKISVNDVMLAVKSALRKR